MGTYKSPLLLQKFGDNMREGLGNESNTKINKKY